MDGNSRQSEYEKSPEFTLRLFKEGHSAPEIAYRRNLAVTTIENHLRRLLEDGRINIKELLDENMIEQVIKASEGEKSLSAIKSKLPEDMSYGEIRYVLSHMGRTDPWKSRITSIVNTYIGNYCQRKCFNHLDVIMDCQTKFNKLAEGMDDISINFRELKRMIDDDAIQICKLPPGQKENVCVMEKLRIPEGDRQRLLGVNISSAIF